MKSKPGAGAHWETKTMNVDLERELEFTILEPEGGVWNGSSGVEKCALGVGSWTGMLQDGKCCQLEFQVTKISWLGVRKIQNWSCGGAAWKAEKPELEYWNTYRDR